MTAPAKIHRLLLDSAERAPSHTAYIHGDDALSYEDLAVRAARAAWAMRERGIELGDRVALVLGRQREYLVAHYGVLMAGGTVVPLGRRTRSDELARVLAGVGARAAVVDGVSGHTLATVARALPDLRTVIRVGAAADLPDLPGSLGFEDVTATGPEFRDACPGDDALASIHYPHGTRGAGRGVVVTHRDQVHSVSSIVRDLELAPEDRVAMVVPYHFLHGNCVLHTHLAVGGTIVGPGTPALPDGVFEAIERHGCTGLCGVSSALARLLDAAGSESRDLRSLRYVTQAGPAMSHALADRLTERLPGVSVYVMRDRPAEDPPAAGVPGTAWCAAGVAHV